MSWRRLKREQSLDQELADYLERETADNMARGMSAEDARLAARRKLGPVARVKEETRSAWGWTWIERLFQDLRYGRRTLKRNPGFALIAIMSLAVGIGANCAIFTLADTLLLRPLPVPDPRGVLTIGSRDTAGAADPGGFSILPASYPDYRDIRDKATSFQGVAAFDFERVAFAADTRGPARLDMGMTVSGNFFEVMQVAPELGRAFGPEEDRAPGRDTVVVLSHDLWTREFASDRSAIGREVRLNGIAFTVIGVMPPEFSGVDRFVYSAFYVPMMMKPALDANPANALEDRNMRVLMVKGRLKPGVSLARARAELAALSSLLAKTYPATNKTQTMDARTELDARIRQSPPLAGFTLMVMVLAAAVLLVACANVAGLLTSRAPARAREMALRLAIGSGRPRLILQLLTESLLLALGGCIAGVGLAYAGVLLLRQITIPSDLPLMISFDLDQRALEFGLAAGVLSVFLFGLIPAVRTSRTDLATALKAGSTTVAGAGRLWGRNVLVSGQVAVALMMLTVALFMFRAFRASLAAGPGYRTDHLAMMSFDPAVAHYDAAQDREFYQRLLDRSRDLPGAKAAALVSFVPMDVTSSDAFAIVPERVSLPGGSSNVSVMGNRVSEDYFEAAGVPLLRGRGFLDSDTASAPRVAVVNQALANHYWPQQDAIGKRFQLDGDWVEIVGVAKTTKYESSFEAPIDFLYLPYRQNPRTAMTLMVESAGDARPLIPPLREVVRSLDAAMPVFDVRLMEDFYRERAIRTNLVTIQAIAAMGLMGMALAMTGLYGLMAYAVSARTREIGIRMTIGASRGEVMRMVLRQGLTLAAAGIAAGEVLSLGAARAMQAAFGGGGGPRATAYLTVAPLALAVTMLAAYVPARRAAKVDPAVALRDE